MTTLDQLGLHQKATIAQLDSLDPVLARRLVSMGLVAGADIEIVGFAPFGDPITVRTLRYVLSLRRSEARTVRVTPV